MDEARKDKTFQNVDVNLKFSKPELQLTIDRMKAKDLGLSISDVADVVSSAFSGRRLAYFTMKGKQYDVISQVSLKDRQTPSDILSLYVRNNRGEMIPLSAVVDLKESSNPPTLFHYNRFRSATISASLAEGKTIGDGVKAMDDLSKNYWMKVFILRMVDPLVILKKVLLIPLLHFYWHSYLFIWYWQVNSKALKIHLLL